jgi:cardiolipin synthase A/B
LVCVDTWLTLWHHLLAQPAIAIAIRVLGWMEIGLQLACVLAVLARRREPSVTLAWLLGIVLFPIVGMVLFWFFGRDRVRRSARPRLRLLAERRAEESGADIEAIPQAMRSLARTAWQTGRAAVTVGNQVETLVDGSQVYPALLDAIAGAERTVDATYYSFARDATGHRFRDALVAAAQRGVRVRVLVDALGSVRLGGFLSPLKAAGGEWHPFMPFNPFDGLSLNLRNHRKILVVDGHIGFIGGLNIGDEYLRGTPSLGAWRDTNLGIRGPAVAELQAVFADDWAFTTGTPMEPKLALAGAPAPGSCPVQILPSGPDDRAEAIYNVFFAAISIAKRTLDLATPYFVPDLAIWVAIRSAAMRGVRVRIIVPAHSDQWLTAAASRSYGEELMTAGVEIYRYSPGMMHAKTMIIDGEWASVGTANMDVRSFRLNFEVTALLYDRATIQPLQDSFERDIARSELVDPRWFSQRSFFQRAIEGFARLLSPLL